MWDTAEFGGTDTLGVQAGMVWTPGIGLSNR